MCQLEDIDVIKDDKPPTIPSSIGSFGGGGRRGVKGHLLEEGGWWVNQGESRLSTSRDNITDCKLDSVGYASVCRCKYGELIWTCLFWAASPNCLVLAERSKPDIFGCHATDKIPLQVTERNYSDHYTDSEPASRLDSRLISARWQPGNFPVLKERKKWATYYTSSVINNQKRLICHNVIYINK